MMHTKRILLVLAAGVTVSLSAQFSTSPELLKQHVFYLASDSLLGRGFGTEQGLEASDYIARRFSEAGIEPYEGDYFHPFTHRTGILNIRGRNVVGVIPGSDPELRGEYIVVGAHYDHLGWKVSDGDTVVYNGADDNASGIASIIEIGRNLAGNAESPGRSIIIVAFDGEESGLIGSTHFVEDSTVSPEKISLMFSLDMVGMYKAHEGVDLHGVKQLTGREWLTGELAAKHDLVVRKSDGQVVQRTDTAPFGNRGIPAIHVFTGTESPYHKPEDDADLLDFEGMAVIADYLSDALLQLSRAGSISDLQPVEETAVKDRIFTPGVRLNLGSGHHEYPEAFYKAKSIFATQAGLFADIRITRFLTLQPEVLYQTAGSRHPDGKFRTHSVTVPLNLLISNPGQRGGGLRTSFQIGGYYSHHFAGKTDNGAVDFTEEYNDGEYGISYGFGFQVMRFQYGVRFQSALSELYRSTEAEKVLPGHVYFLMGFTF